MKLTEFAIQAEDAIQTATIVTFHALADADRTDAAFECSPNPNEAFTKKATQFLSGACLIAVVDAYQWYNGQIFRLLAKHRPDSLERIGEGVNLSPSDLRRIAVGEDAIGIAAEKISFRDSAVRKHLHKVLDLWEEGEMSVMVEIRNCLSHHQGMDVEGRVKAWLSAGKSAWRLNEHISLDGTTIVLGKNISWCLLEICLAQISIFDQEVAHSFGLPTREHPKSTISRHFKG